MDGLSFFENKYRLNALKPAMHWSQVEEQCVMPLSVPLHFHIYTLHCIGHVCKSHCAYCPVFTSFINANVCSIAPNTNHLAITAAVP